MIAAYQPEPVWVTVVTPVFNLRKYGREKTFVQCLESVHAQEHPYVEHIVVDGASQDGSLELLREYEARGWCRVISEPDKGIFDAMNKGLVAARGKYIAFLNSDDYWHDSRAVSESVFLLEQAQADYSYAAARIIGEKDELVRISLPHIGRFFCEMPFCHQTVFCRTELMREMGGFDDEQFRIAADFDFVMRMMLRGCKGVMIPLTFTSFREGGVSTLPECRPMCIEERLKVLRKQYGHELNEEEIKLLEVTHFPISFFRRIQQMVREEVAVDMDEQMTPSADPSLHRLWGLEEPRPQEEPQVKQREPRQIPPPKAAESYTRQWSGLFGLPLLSYKRRHARRARVSLFRFLPLMDIRSSERSAQYLFSRYLLFGFIPLLKTKRSLDLKTWKLYLFDAILIWSSRLRSEA